MHPEFMVAHEFNCYKRRPDMVPTEHKVQFENELAGEKRSNAAFRGVATRHAMDGRSSIRAWLLDLHQWQPFTVIGLPNTTRESLSAEPIIPKPHWSSK